MAQIKLSVNIDVPAEQVYPLVATARGFSQWWAEDVSENNGIVDLGFFKRATLYQLRLLRNTPGHEAEWRCLTGQEWAETRLRFDLASSSGKTLVRFLHTDWKAETEYFVSCTATWGALMYRLKSAAEGKKPGPFFSANGMSY